MQLMLPVGGVGRKVLVRVGISVSAVPMLLLLLRLAMLLKGGSLPRFSVIARFRIDAWMADVACPIACQPIWPACWLDIPDRSSSSSSRLVQDVWDVYRDELGVVPNDVVLALRDAVTRSAVDDFWSIWSSFAEAGLFRASSLAGGPTTAGSSAFLGRGQLRIRSRLLGGRAVGGTGSSRLYRACQGDEVDKHCAQFFYQLLSFSCVTLS